MWEMAPKLDGPITLQVSFIIHLNIFHLERNLIDSSLTLQLCVELDRITNLNNALNNKAGDGEPIVTGMYVWIRLQTEANYQHVDEMM